jgi:mono/diheme cytochrome c family protein
MDLKLIHIISAFLFMLIYIVKTSLLVMDKTEALTKFKKATKVVEMIVSAGFLITGVWLFWEIGNIKTLQIIKLICVFASIPLAVIGFKKGNKALAVISVLLVIAAYGLAEMAKKQPYPGAHVEEVSTATPQESQEFGQEVYKANCAACHGLDGMKGLGGATDLSKSQLNKAGIIDVVTNGRGNMTPFKDQLSEHEIDATADFILTLKK